MQNGGQQKVTGNPGSPVRPLVRDFEIVTVYRLILMWSEIAMEIAAEKSQRDFLGDF
jgi:hypothetical protein